MSGKKDYDPYMNDFEREVFEALGMEFKYSPRELKLIDDFQSDLDSLNPDIPYSFKPLRKLKRKWEERVK